MIARAEERRAIDEVRAARQAARAADKAAREEERRVAEAAAVEAADREASVDRIQREQTDRDCAARVIADESCRGGC